ncbi:MULTISPECIES: hypothetical protein [Streptomyces]|uniref:hypothetical protein n=1 Tax=Streptomyces TaxID=1883 RepID=UPI000ADEAE7E|nr:MULTISPECIES: hypothetical protein [Streptomyces]MCH0556749.1 hypothetical protein [Streptomyces sp. MUM 16J]
MPSAVRVLGVHSLTPLLLLTPPVPPSAAAPTGGRSLTPTGGGRPERYAEGMPGTVLWDSAAVAGLLVRRRPRGTGRTEEAGHPCEQIESRGVGS